VRWATLLLLLGFGSAAVHAGEVRKAEVEHADGRYIVEIDVIVNAREDAVHQVLTDYAHLTRVHENIKQSEILFSLDDHTHQVRVVAEACITYFCKSMIQTQDVLETDAQTIIVTAVPEKSDFVFAHSRWKITPTENGTRVMFNTDLKPRFWVPPVIGPYLIKKKLHTASVETVLNLEKLANP
jgi:hypothetical protein